MKRKSGVLMHISSLWGEFSCGSFSDEAKNFIDFLADCGFSYWQVLPFNPVDEYGSPYKSYSAFAGNINFIDIKQLFFSGLITAEELEESRQTTPYLVEFERLFEKRAALLTAASKRVDNALKEEIDCFMKENPQIENYCTFMALKEANGFCEWQKWKKTDINSETLFMHRFSQYEFFVQWKKIKYYAKEKGIKIIGDVPIYVASDSADTLYNPKQFKLDEKGYPAEVAGVPPDYFSADGQLWGNPLYDFSHMEENGFKWWKERINHMFTLFDGIRIDHFRAFESYWSVPADAKTAAEGKWIKGPGMKLIDALNEIKGDKLIIAEDLGDITEEVAKLVEESGYPGMRVFQFGFLSDSDSTHKPHNYINHSVAYSGTHDNNTLLGYLWELDDAKRREVLTYCGYKNPNWEEGYENMVRSIMASAAGIAIFPIQDILKYGSDTRLNTPGKTENNWRFRITENQLSGIDRAYWKELNRTYGRL